MIKPQTSRTTFGYILFNLHWLSSILHDSLYGEYSSFFFILGGNKVYMESFLSFLLTWTFQFGKRKCPSSGGCFILHLFLKSSTTVLLAIRVTDRDATLLSKLLRLILRNILIVFFPKAESIGGMFLVGWFVKSVNRTFLEMHFGHNAQDA